MRYSRLAPVKVPVPLGYLPHGLQTAQEASRRDNPNYPLLSVTYRSPEIALQRSAQGVKRQSHLEHDYNVPL